MPFKSIAQDRWAHTPSGMQALGGPAKVAEWDSATKGMALPKKIGTGVRKPKIGGSLEGGSRKPFGSFAP